MSGGSGVNLHAKPIDPVVNIVAAYDDENRGIIVKYRALGKTGFNVSTVCFGTWTIGGADWGRTDDRDSIKAIHRALDLGVNIFDTAPIYGSGHAEKVLGQALDGVRDQVFLATKCGPWEDELGRLRLDLSKQGIRGQCIESLKRLKTDRIDLMQVHWNDTAWPVEETMQALADLKNEGLIRSYGVSNFSPSELTRAAEGGCMSLQSPYSLVNRDVERELLPMCEEKDLGFLAYEPLGRGLLAGRYSASTRFEQGDIRLTDPRFRGPEFTDLLKRVERLKQVCESIEVTPAQAAIAWVMAKSGVTTAICGIRTATQAVQNARAAEVEIDDSTMARLESIFS